MNAYPIELRRRIVDAVDRGVGSLPVVADLFRVSLNCVLGLLRLREETGSLHPRPNKGGRQPAIGPERYDELRQVVADQPDITLDGIRERMGLSCSLAAICRTLKKLDLTRKKKTLVASEREREDVRAMRDDWAAWQAELTETKLSRLVFWDESWAITAMTPTYGRAPKGQRVVEAVPAGNWERLTIAAAIRLSGVCGALVYEGGTTVEAAEAFLRGGLDDSVGTGDIVIMDRLSSHTHPEIIAALSRRGAEVKILPPYSPDLNPIEKAFSKVKKMLRRAAARTTEGLIDAIADALRAITTEDLRAWFEYCGYQSDS